MTATTESALPKVLRSREGLEAYSKVVSFGYIVLVNDPRWIMKNTTLQIDEYMYSESLTMRILNLSSTGYQIKCTGTYYTAIASLYHNIFARTRERQSYREIAAFLSPPGTLVALPSKQSDMEGNGASRQKPRVRTLLTLGAP